MDEWNKDRMKRLDFISKRLSEKNKARACINNVDEAMLEYNRVFAKQIKPLPPVSQLSDVYHPSEAQKSGELFFGAVGTGISTYALYTLNKLHTKRSYIKHTIKWIVFGLVSRQ